MSAWEGAQNAIDAYIDRKAKEQRDIEARVGMLEAQVEVLRRALALSLASAGPGLEWLGSMWSDIEDGEKSG